MKKINIRIIVPSRKAMIMAWTLFNLFPIVNWWYQITFRTNSLERSQIPNPGPLKVKGHRRSPVDMVESFLEELQHADGSSDEGFEEYFSLPTSPTSAEAARNPGPDNILDYLDDLEPLTDNNCYQNIRLTIRARCKLKESIYQQLSNYLVGVLSRKSSVSPCHWTPATRLLTRKQIRKKKCFTKDLEKIWSSMSGHHSKWVWGHFVTSQGKHGILLARRNNWASCGTHPSLYEKTNARRK